MANKAVARELVALAGKLVESAKQEQTVIYDWRNLARAVLWTERWIAKGYKVFIVKDADDYPLVAAKSKEEAMDLAVSKGGMSKGTKLERIKRTEALFDR